MIGFFVGTPVVGFADGVLDGSLVGKLVGDRVVDGACEGESPDQKEESPTDAQAYEKRRRLFLTPSGNLKPNRQER